MIAKVCKQASDSDGLVFMEDIVQVCGLGCCELSCGFNVWRQLHRSKAFDSYGLVYM